MPQRIVVVFSAQWVFSIFELNMYITFCLCISIAYTFQLWLVWF